MVNEFKVMHAVDLPLCQNLSGGSIWLNSLLIITPDRSLAGKATKIKRLASDGNQGVKISTAAKTAHVPRGILVPVPVSSIRSSSK